MPGLKQMLVQGSLFRHNKYVDLDIFLKSMLDFMFYGIVEAGKLCGGSNVKAETRRRQSFLRVTM